MTTGIKKILRYLPGLGLIVVVIALIIWQQFKAPPVHFRNTPVACIDGHENLSQHFHATVMITIDGVAEIIPANVCIIPGCMAEVHTHDTTGELHIESSQPGKTFRLGDFFAVWGTSIDRPGYALEMLVNGAPHTNGSDFVLRDDQRIELRYSKK